MTYHQLTAEEREVLAHMLYGGATKTAIAEMLRRDIATIRAEIKRGSEKGVYCCVAAQRKAGERRRAGRAACRKMQREEMSCLVKEGLQKAWSPEQISGEMRNHHPHNRDFRISPQTIYDWLKHDDHSRPYRCHLRRYRSRKRRPRPARPGAIAHRPQEINERQRFGDWEGDLIVGPPGGGALVSLVERKSGYTRLIKVRDRKALTVNRAIAGALEGFPPEMRRSITFDQGSEFAGSEQLSRWLGMEVYFADPHAPWQRGTNENTNGLVRQYFPKGTDFQPIRDKEVARVETLLNERPRKRLGFRNPQKTLAPPMPATLYN